MFNYNYPMAMSTPSYSLSDIVANPYTGVSYTSYGCGYGSTCGCNS